MGGSQISSGTKRSRMMEKMRAIITLPATVFYRAARDAPDHRFLVTQLSQVYSAKKNADRYQVSLDMGSYSTLAYITTNPLAQNGMGDVFMPTLPPNPAAQKEQIGLLRQAAELSLVKAKAELADVAFTAFSNLGLATEKIGPYAHYSRIAQKISYTWGEIRGLAKTAAQIFGITTMVSLAMVAASGGVLPAIIPIITAGVSLAAAAVWAVAAKKVNVAGTFYTLYGLTLGGKLIEAKVRESPYAESEAGIQNAASIDSE